MYKIMTPGPTQVRENVRMARSLACTNPDLDPAFYDYYKETCEPPDQEYLLRQEYRLYS